MPPTILPPGENRVHWGDLILRHRYMDAKSEFYETREPLTVEVGEYTQLTVPAGMATDGASIPRFWWRVVGPPMCAAYTPAAVVHDAAYLGKLRWLEMGTAKPYTRKDADDLFRALMATLGVPAWRRDIMWAAVRACGGSRWTPRVNPE